MPLIIRQATHRSSLVSARAVLVPEVPELPPNAGMLLHLKLSSRTVGCCVLLGASCAAVVIGHGR